MVVLAQAVRTAAQEFDEAEVAEDLEVLADFGPDVVIGGVKCKIPGREGGGWGTRQVHSSSK